MEREDRVRGGSQTRSLTTDRLVVAGLGPGNRNPQRLCQAECVCLGTGRLGSGEGGKPAKRVSLWPWQ